MPSTKATFACMLAHDYKKNGKPQYGVSNWTMSEKYDGQRGIWTGKDFLTRNGQKITAPQWFLDMLSLSTHPIDGELFFGRGKFGMTGTLRASRVDELAWKKVVYKVFDIPDPSSMLTLRQRLDKLKKTVRMMSVSHSHDRFPIEVVEYIDIKNSAHIESFFKEITEAKGEGLILRNPYSLYENSRSTQLLRYKPLHDSEAIIVSYKPGNGKFKGMLGAFNVRDIHTNKEFSISGFVTSIRASYKTTHPIGTIITYYYTELTCSGKPRYPRYKGKRTDITVPTTETDVSVASSVAPKEKLRIKISRITVT